MYFKIKNILIFSFFIYFSYLITGFNGFWLTWVDKFAYLVVLIDRSSFFSDDLDDEDTDDWVGGDESLWLVGEFVAGLGIKSSWRIVMERPSQSQLCLCTRRNKPVSFVEDLIFDVVLIGCCTWWEFVVIEVFERFNRFFDW